MMDHCQIHNIPLTQLTLSPPFCIPCHAAQTIRESAARDTEPDYDLMGKYGRPSDSHLDDPAATAMVGFGWWKGV